MQRILGLVFLWAAISAPAQAQVVSGPATVVDGKTLDLTGTAIMLAHIDAPEIRQECERDGVAWACGSEAAENLTAIIDQMPVTCTIIGKNADGVPLANCQNRQFDLGREMVRRGFALPLDNAPEEYGAATGIAQRLQYGLWGATYQPPDEWRAANPAAVTRVARAESVEPSFRSSATMRVPEKRYTGVLGCTIKGNHSRYGDLIYHLPGQKYYSQTRPEALFCTEREAQAAGFRRSKE